VVADSFQGLVTVSSESSFRVPLGWILGQPSLPYRAFHVFDGRIVAELAPFHLLVSPTAEESWPSPEDGTMDDPPGRYLIVSVGTFLVALPLSSVAQITDTMGLCRYPRLPAPVLGMVLYRGTPVPVLRLLESSVHDGAIVVLRNQAGHLGVAVDATRGMADLFPPFVPEASVPPDFLGGCTVLHADHSPAPVFTVDPDRLWRSLAR
jgi:hypothetical protein